MPSCRGRVQGRYWPKGRERLPNRIDAAALASLQLLPLQSRQLRQPHLTWTGWMQNNPSTANFTLFSLLSSQLQHPLLHFDKCPEPKGRVVTSSNSTPFRTNG